MSHTDKNKLAEGAEKASWKLALDGVCYEHICQPEGSWLLGSVLPGYGQFLPLDHYPSPEELASLGTRGIWLARESSPAPKLAVMCCGQGAWEDELLASTRELRDILESKGIQTRMLFSGNLIKHPCFDQLREEGTGYRVVGDLANTDRIMRDTFWIGVYPGMTDAMIDYMTDTISEAVR